MEITLLGIVSFMWTMILLIINYLVPDKKEPQTKVVIELDFDDRQIRIIESRSKKCYKLEVKKYGNLTIKKGNVGKSGWAYNIRPITKGD